MLPLLLLPLLSAAILPVLLYAVIARLQRARTPPHTVSRAAVLVLGDVGRSPRMQYHALSLANSSPSTHVDLIGYSGARCHEAILQHPRIHLCLLQPWPYKRARGAFFLLVAPIKVLYQLAQLMLALLVQTPRADVLLVQNPPAIPVLAVAAWTTWLRASRLVIDWHNFGYTLLQLGLGDNPKHPFVVAAYWYERFFGRFFADAHLCVTQAMAEHLRAVWKIEASVLYDRAPESFRRLSGQERHELWKRLEGEADWLQGLSWGGSDDEPAAGDHIERTLFTEHNRQTGEWTDRSDRPALLISSTSWTPDEDFGVLLDAIVRCDKRPELPDRVLFVITGKGPMKEYYEQRIAELNLQRVRVATAWLAFEDYPRLLGAADLGVSLHTSSSGLDLPMKVVDMFGCGLPVLAVNFACLDELVHHGRNGMVFEDSAELAEQLVQVLSALPTDTSKLDAMREHVREFQEVRWEESWHEHAWPSLRG